MCCCVASISATMLRYSSDAALPSLTRTWASAISRDFFAFNSIILDMKFRFPSFKDTCRHGPRLISRGPGCWDFVGIYFSEGDGEEGSYEPLSSVLGRKGNQLRHTRCHCRNRSE